MGVYRGAWAFIGVPIGVHGCIYRGARVPIRVHGCIYRRARVPTGVHGWLWGCMGAYRVCMSVYIGLHGRL